MPLKDELELVQIHNTSRKADHKPLLKYTFSLFLRFKCIERRLDGL